ncbi:MAG: glycoside hydrolase family 172 protein [Phycisphaerales bacterium]
MGGIMQRLGLVCLFVSVCSSVGLAGPSAITTGSLFEEMVDMANLARFPEPAFRTVQFSSYDHRSKLPGGPDWFANADGFGGEPIPNFEAVLKAPDANGVGEYLVADVEGPGAIVRLWTAAISGSIRMYLDGSEDPVYEGSADDFFHRPYDLFSQIDGIDKDRFRRTIYQRDASYAPIPFAKRLRVVWTGNTKEIHFYQLQVRLYDEGTSVVTFQPEDIRKYRETIDRVSLVLSDPDKNLPPGSREPSPFDLNLKTPGSGAMANLKGPAAIGQLSLKLTADDMDKALRQTLLTITCDDYPWGQVQSPVGDFFGAAPGVNPYQSLPFTVQPDGTMVCRFVMPFERSCRVELHNLGDQVVGAKGAVHTIPFAWDERTMHFRARWRVDHDLIASNRAVQDLPFLLVCGKGVYVGTGVYLMNPCPVPTPYGNWWGEGDEKVFVDRDAVPSTFGTGSEDYFNYSWSSPDIFTYPYCGQPRNDGPGNRGFVTNYRWHILDPIPFQESIRFYMELYSHERTPGMSYARIGYHYARPGVTDDHMILLPKTLELPALPPWQPAARMGAAKSEFFVAEDVAADAKGTTLKEAPIWAGGKLLVWTPANKGDRKSFKIPVRAAGKKQIHVAFAMTPQSGQVAFRLDDQPLQLADEARTLDLHCLYRTLLRSIDLMPTELTAGEHTLTLESVGASEGIASPEIGIDFIWVQDR